MADMQRQIGAILDNPEMMAQIMSLAQNIGQAVPEHSSAPPPQEPASWPDGFDPAMLQAVSALAQNSSIDPNQQNLVNALGPYLSHRKLQKLQKAMQAAKMAGLATSFLGR